MMICASTRPKGWGGEITGSSVEDRYPVVTAVDGNADAASKASVQSIATPDRWDLKLVEVNDRVSYAICGDGGGTFS
jgi:hypothetical protein